MVDQTLQPYAYASDTPANASDPSGLNSNHWSYSKRQRFAFRYFDEVLKRRETLHGPTARWAFLQSAALVGNFMEESSLDPRADQARVTGCGPRQSCGKGIAQWCYKNCYHHFNRWNTLYRYAHRHNPNSRKQPQFIYQIQVHFVWVELKSSPLPGYSRPGVPAGSNALRDLEATTKLREATLVVMYQYEAPEAGEEHSGRRVQDATNVCKAFAAKQDKKYCRS